MKKISKILGASILTLGLTLSSCESLELDLRENPNALSPEQASPDYLLNQTQLSFNSFVQSMGRIGAELTRIEYMFGKTYANVYGPAGFNGAWSTAYATVFEDIKALEPIAQETGLDYHLGMAKFIKAYMLVTMVDYFGDIPLSEANLGADNFNPSADKGADVYAAAKTLINEAITHFNTSSAKPAIDLYYGGDETKWIKACNTLKLKMFITTYKVSGSIDSEFATITSDPENYISENTDDLQFAYGSREVQPDTRHPDYASDYSPSGGNLYRSIHLMNYMTNNDDPRTRYYFFRQVAFTPGQDEDPDLEALQCSLQTAPEHYITGGYPFCGLPNGYWGRDHGNNEGIPPDNFKRTIVGVYPAGGAFDDNRFEDLGDSANSAGGIQGAGAQGKGITPMLLASSVSFWRAEVAMVNGDKATAKTHMIDGIAKSIDKVMNFGEIDTTADLSYAPTASDITAYLNDVIERFDNDSEGGWNILGQEYFVSLYGNGSDAYNFYRRTGYPNNLQPNQEPNPGAFIRSLQYPANYVNTNKNAKQKTDWTQPVFWDNNSTTLY